MNKILYLLIWFSLMYGNGFMWLYKGYYVVAKYHGMAIWVIIVILNIINSVIEHKSFK